MRVGESVASLSAFALSVAPTSALAATVRQTVEVPVRTAPVPYSSVNYPANHPVYYCPSDSRNYPMGAAPPGFTRVGFEHKYDDGTPPLPCEWVQTNIQRLRMSFDLDGIKARIPRAFVYSALLSFDRRHVAGSDDCADQLLTVIGEGRDGPTGMGLPPALEERFDNPLPAAGCSGERCRVDIKGQVNEWLMGKVADLGMVIRGPNESIGSKDNLACTTDYGNLRLMVDYSYDSVDPVVKPVPITGAPSGPVIPILKTFPTGGGGGGGGTSPITLKVTFVRKQGGNAVYDLDWNKTGSGMLDLVRNGTVIEKVPDKGSARDKSPLGTQKYKVCLTATTNCSNEVTVTN